MVNRSGFSLIEVMISLSITTFGTLALLASIESSMKAQRAVASLTDYDTFQNQLKMFSGNPSLCAQIFKGSGPNGSLVMDTSGSSVGAPVLQAIDLAGDVYKPGTRLISGSTITSMSFQFVGASTVPGDYSTYLKISGQKNTYSTGTSTLREFNLPITLSTDASGVVTSCRLGADPNGLDYGTLCTNMFHGTLQSMDQGNGMGPNKICVLPTPSPAPNGNEQISLTCSFPAGQAGWETCSCPNQNPNVTGWSGSNCEQNKPGRWGCFQSNGTSNSMSVYSDGSAASTITVYCKK